MYVAAIQHLNYTEHYSKQSIFCVIFLMYVAAIQHLNYTEHYSKQSIFCVIFLMYVAAIQHLNYTEHYSKQSIFCVIFLMYVAAIQHLNYTEHYSKQSNLQFAFMTHLWPWHKVNIISPSMTQQITHKVITMQFERPHKNTVQEKVMFKFLLDQKTCQLFPWNAWECGK